MGLLLTGTVAFGYQARTQDPASIQGTVIAKTTGSALKNAIVTLRHVPENPKQIRVKEAAQRTDEQGRFFFADVTPGEWELSADKSGFATGKYAASKYNPQGGRVTVKTGQQLRDVVLRLIPQSVIAGRVLNNEGEPVEGVRVSVLKARYADGAPQWSEIAAAVTLDNGEYRIPRISPGRYLVRSGITTTGSSGIGATYAAAYHPNATEPSQAATVEVRDDGAEISGIDLRLVPVRVYHVQGRLLTPGGQSGAQVFLLERSDPSKVFDHVVVRPPNYLFDFPQVPPGAYVAYASYWMAGDFRASQPVEVRGEDVENLVLTAAAGEIRGSVRLKTEGRQVDLSTVSVMIRPTNFRAGNRRMPGTVKYDERLTFRYPLSGLEFAVFAVELSRIPEGCYLWSIQYGGREVAESGIEYSADAELQITIAADGASVDGSTLDKDGNPVSNAVVVLIPADGKRAPHSSISGSSGAFHFSGIRPGEYKLVALDDVGQDDLGNPGFARRFENQGTAEKLEANVATSVSVPVIEQEPVR